MLEDYLHKDENIERHWSLEKTRKIKEHLLVVTNKRVIQFQEKKRYNIRYRDVPIKNISYLEHEWHSRNIILLILSGILIIFTIFYLFFTRFSYFGWMTSIPLFIIAIILLIKGLKQYGYILINNER